MYKIQIEFINFVVWNLVEISNKNNEMGHDTVKSFLTGSWDSQGSQAPSEQVPIMHCHKDSLYVQGKVFRFYVTTQNTQE